MCSVGDNPDLMPEVYGGGKPPKTGFASDHNRSPKVLNLSDGRRRPEPDPAPADTGLNGAPGFPVPTLE